MRLSVLFILTIWAVFQGQTQDVDLELKGITQHYAGLEGFIFETEVKVSNRLDRYERPVITDYVIRGSGSKYYISEPEYTMIINDQYFLMVDRVQKVVILDSARNYSKERQYDPVMVLDTLLGQANEKNWQAVDEETAQITLTFENDRIGRVDIYYDRKTYAYRRIIYTYRTEVLVGSGNIPEVELTIRRFEKDPEFGSQAFSIDPYIVKTNHKHTLSKAYGTYQFFNQIE